MYTLFKSWNHDKQFKFEGPDVFPTNEIIHPSICVNERQEKRKYKRTEL